MKIDARDQALRYEWCTSPRRTVSGLMTYAVVDNCDRWDYHIQYDYKYNSVPHPSSHDTVMFLFSNRRLKR